MASSKWFVTWSCCVLVMCQVSWGADLAFRDQELNTRLGVGYAVRLLDMNADEKLDIVIVDQDRILWLANPNWEEHVIIEGQTKKDNVCFAPCDIDGDGNIDFAVGAEWNPGNTASGGTIQWLKKPKENQGKWAVHAIGEEPTTHRMQFVDLDKDGRHELIVAPLLGRNSTRPNYAENGVRLLAYTIPKDPIRDTWTSKVLDKDMHVCHNFCATDLNSDDQIDLVAVSFEGVHLLERQSDDTWRRTRIGEGNQITSPNRGASEIKHGQLANGQDYLATIEPWHGSQVVLYRRPTAARPTNGEWLWERRVLDDQLQWGHAVWCANLDQDADEELIIGVRDDLSTPPARRGLRIYDPTPDGDEWKRFVVDPGGVAIEDLAAADLNRDGLIDIVAVGRQTHNVKIYWNESR